MEEAIGENAIAGIAMAPHAVPVRRSVPRGEKGQVDAGLGKALSFGTTTLVAPTELIDKPVETRRVDGVDIVFELTPGAEAPAEMIMYYPQFRVLNMVEIATQNMHNLLPIRGALVRDALSWSKYIGGALQRYGARSDVVIAQHTWPVWGTQRVQDYLKKQRDTYKFIHDQTVRLMNQGYVGTEIAEAIKMPPSLAQEWSTHPFYGQLKNNVQAVYQRYLGYVRRQPGRPRGAAAGAGREKGRGVHGRRRRGAQTRPRRLLQGRVPLGGSGGVAARVRRPDESGGARPDRRRLRAAGLPDGIRHRPQRLPAGRLGVAATAFPSCRRARRARPTSSVP